MPCPLAPVPADVDRCVYPQQVTQKRIQRRRRLTLILPDPIGPPHHAHSCRQHFLPFSFALLLLLLVPLPWHCCLPRHLRRQCFLCRRRVVACVSIDNKTQAKLKDEEEDVLLPLAPAFLRWGSTEKSPATAMTRSAQRQW